MNTVFEWDGPKSQANVRKHGVRFEEAATVFEDSLAVIFSDDKHSEDELRELIVGESSSRRLLVASFTTRGNILRIISARRATKWEQKDYRENRNWGGLTLRETQMKDEYRFDYTKAKPNRFATEFTGRQIMVALDPDVTAVFKTGEQVNRALRALMEIVPDRDKDSIATVSED